RAGATVARSAPAALASPAQAPPAVATNPTDVLAGHAAQAEKDLDAKLVAVDSRSFTPEQAALYIQASELARASRNAMGKHDYTAALNLSAKAAQVAQSLIDKQKMARDS